MKPALAILMLVAMLLAACASTPPPNCVAFGRGQFCLLPPSELAALDGAHMVTIDHDGQEQMYIGQLHIDAHVIRLAGSSLFGPSLFTVSYDGQVLHSAPAGGPQRADILIAMLELVVADPNSLQAAMRGLTLTQNTRADGVRVRELFQQKHLVAQIEIGAGTLTDSTIRFQIPAAKLSVVMQPLGDQSASLP